MQDLFTRSDDRRPLRGPLADRMRPRTLEEFVGQEDLIGPDRPLRKLLEERAELPSMILWGPPGSGKTTLARLLAGMTRAHFTQFSAVTSGVKEVKEVIEAARYRRAHEAKATLLFVDEIHRFNRAQQDAFLPHLEDGSITLIGATTENPSFEVIPALLSRCRVFTLRRLTEAEIRHLLERTLSDSERGVGDEKITLENDALDMIANLANGDARAALNLLEMACTSMPRTREQRRITLETLRRSAQRRVTPYDKNREEHYNTISAFIKSMRSSDPDAALYWLARMLESGEDPLFIARRLAIFASEDVGNADPQAIQVAVACMQAVDFLGMPEGFLPMAQATTYLATALKSNASYEGYLAAKKDVLETRNEPVPLHLRNAVTPLMRKEGYGKGYEYAHDQPGAIVTHSCLPENLTGRRYYLPRDSGHEGEIKKRMDTHRKKK